MMSLIMKAIAIIASAPPNFGVIALEIWRAVLGAAHYYSLSFFAQMFDCSGCGGVYAM